MYLSQPLLGCKKAPFESLVRLNPTLIPKPKPETAHVLLQSRGCPLRGLPGTPDLEAQRRRFTENGWQRAEAADMDTIHRCHIDPVDRQRCARRPLRV